MTSPMLEKMARALADHFNCEWDTMRDADRETIRGYVRAALIALREPDEGMVNRGTAAINFDGPAPPDASPDPDYSDDARRIFTAMIDQVRGGG